MTYVLVAGYHTPYLAAKSAASLDLLSNGWFILDTGVGYLKSEFSALQADFDRRGALMDEAIAVWTGAEPSSPEFGVAGHAAMPLPAAIERTADGARN